jgi:uncharacterized protein (TIGR02231 family)
LELIMTLRPLLLVILFTTVLAQAQDATRITRVTLYPGSATVERVARIAANASKLEIAGLPANFDVRTIRLEADAGIRLGEFTVHDVARSAAMNPRQAELEARIEALGDQLAQLNVDSQSAELVTAYLKALGAPAGSNKALSPEGRNLSATLEAIRQGGGDAYSRIQKVALQKRALEKQQAALQRELAKIAELNRDSRSLSLSLAADKAGEVRISYQVNGPGWQPVYRASLDSASASVEIERQALIAQNSGEDWSNVALRLSTGQPRSAPQGPTPNPWLLSIREPQPPVQSRVSRAEPASAAVAGTLAQERKADAPLFSVTELQAAFETEFEVPVRISLPSDGRKVTVSLARQTLAMKLRVQVVPRQNMTAFLIASGERPQGVWPNGEVQLYRDASYIGATRWNSQDGDKIELPFGRDDLVRVKVNPGKPMNSSGGFIEQRRERQISNEYTVSNQHRQSIDFLLLEPSPTSTNEQIKVESRFTPQNVKQDWDGKPGVVAWELTLPAGATQKFIADYRISWPRDAQLNGL